MRLAITDNPPKTSAQINSAKISASQLVAFVEDIIVIASKLSLITPSTEMVNEIKLLPPLGKSASCLANSLMHDISFSGNRPRKVGIIQSDTDRIRYATIIFSGQDCCIKKKNKI